MRRLPSSSGIAAISTTLFALLKAGDHVVYFAESYQPTRGFIQRALGRYGVSATMLAVTDYASLERTLAAKPTPRTSMAECTFVAGCRWASSHR